MIRKEKEGVHWLEFPLLANEPKLAHGVFLRHGGHSKGFLSTLNLAQNRGDDEDAVKKNRAAIASILGAEELVGVHQVHGTAITHVLDSKMPTPPSDGLMTNSKKLGLLTLHADCQAALFYDPVNHALASVHAGWRGQNGNIYQETIRRMKCTFGTKPANLLVGISPSLGPDNSEFINYRTELPEEFWSFQTKPTYFDLWAIARHQLERAGVLSHHIEIAMIDTYAHPEDFFSYRRERAKGLVTGTHGTSALLL